MRQDTYKHNTIRYIDDDIITNIITHTIHIYMCVLKHIIIFK